MHAKVALLLAIASLVLPGCGSSATRGAVIQAAAAAAIEVGAAALQAAADDANARDAAKQARRAEASRRSPNGNWRLVRQQDDANCDDTNSDDEACQTDSDASAGDVTETGENGLSLGKCIVCQ
jgi:hypothetical protein